MKQRDIPRVMAAILSCGGMAYASLLIGAALGKQHDSVAGFFCYFGFGLLIWAIWVRLACAADPLSVRVGLWLVSVAYNLFWLVCSYEGYTREQTDVLVWWHVAALFSISALALEARRPNQPPEPTAFGRGSA